MRAADRHDRGRGGHQDPRQVPARARERGVGPAPGPTFVKSFLRTYAEYLGLDSRLLVEEYRQRYERPATQDLTPLLGAGARADDGAGGGAAGGDRAGPGDRHRLVIALLVALYAARDARAGRRDAAPSEPGPQRDAHADADAEEEGEAEPGAPRARARPAAARRHRPGLRLPRGRRRQAGHRRADPGDRDRGRAVLRAACSARTSAMTTCGCWSTASVRGRRPAPTRSATSLRPGKRPAPARRTPRGRTARRERPRRDRRHRHRGALGHHPRRATGRGSRSGCARSGVDARARDRRRRPAGRPARCAGLPRRAGDGPDHHQRRARADRRRPHRRGRRRIRGPRDGRSTRRSRSGSGRSSRGCAGAGATSTRRRCGRATASRRSSRGRDGARAGRHRAGAGRARRRRWSRRSSVLPGRRASCSRCGRGASQTGAVARRCSPARASYEQRIMRLYRDPGVRDRADAARRRGAAASTSTAWRSRPACGAARSRSRRASSPPPGAVYDAFEAAVRRAPRRPLFSRDGSTVDELVAGLLLGPPVRTVAVAESCTGGLLAGRLTDRAGSSAYVLGGLVVYSNEAKVALAGVPARADRARRRGLAGGRGGAGRRRARALRRRRRHRHHRHRRAGRRDAGEARRDRLRLRSSRAPAAPRIDAHACSCPAAAPTSATARPRRSHAPAAAAAARGERPWRRDAALSPARRPASSRSSCRRRPRDALVAFRDAAADPDGLAAGRAGARCT